MTTQINFSVDQSRVSVAPGASVEFAVTVQNLTTLLDQVAVSVEGIDASWVQVIPQQLPVFAQRTAEARVIITPAADARQSLAGVYPLRVSGTSQENAGQEGEATAELEIQLVGDYELSMENAGEAGAPEDRYPIHVRNHTNASLEVRLSASDEEHALFYKIEPFQLVVPPGDESASTLAIRARSTTAEKLTQEFMLVAEGEYLLKEDTQTPAPGHQITGQFTHAEPPRLELAVNLTSSQEGTGSAYEVLVGNLGGVAVTVHLKGEDAGGLFDFDFDPEELTLPPQSDSRATLFVRAPTLLVTEGERGEVFRVWVVPADSSVQSVSAQATFTKVAPVRHVEIRPRPVRRATPQLSPAVLLLIGACSFLVTMMFLLILALAFNMI